MLIMVMVICCHWMGCAWWFVADMELTCAAALDADPDAECTPNGWQPREELLRDTLGMQFAAAFFWGAGMVTTMVPYDIEPRTAMEAYVTSLCMFIGLLLNAYVIGSMASALASMDAKKEMCRGKLETISNYLRIHAVPLDLHNSILEFYTYTYTSSQQMLEDLQLFKDLPPSLATRLAITVHRRTVANAAVFRSLSDRALLSALEHLVPTVYVPGQVIQVEHQLIKSVNFIKKGRVALLKHMGKEEEEEIRSIGQNENFGIDEKT